MAWTAPTTRATGDLITAAIWNADLVNNLAWLGGADAVGTSFPGSPADGQLYTYVADATIGVYWTFRYRSAATAWFFVGGPPLYNEVLTNENSASGGAYANLATTGPSILLPFAGDYDVEIGAWGAQINGNANLAAYMSYAIGATAAAEADRILVQQATTTWGAGGSFSRARRKTGLTAVTLTAKYKADAGAVGQFENRWMRVWPVKK